MSSVRAFLAIPLPDELLLGVRDIQTALGTRIGDVRWSPLHNLHLTLHFFADLEQENLEKIKVSMLSVKRCHRPFQVDVNGLGAFPSLQRPRVIWLGLKPQDPIRQLHRDSQLALGSVGVITEARPYAPHLTIGRAHRPISGLAALSEEFRDHRIGPLPIDRLVLYESRLRPGGAEHIPIFTVELDNGT